MYVFKRAAVFASCVALAVGCGGHKATRIATAPPMTHPSVLSPAGELRKGADARRWQAGQYGRFLDGLVKAASDKNAAARREALAAEAARAREATRGSVAASGSTPDHAVASSGVNTTPNGNCWTLLAHYFGDVLDWARRIVQRESHCTAAINREGCDTSGRTDSHAYGPWQICWPLHAAAGDAVGCHDPLNIDCNMRIARYLLDHNGRGPWGG